MRAIRQFKLGDEVHKTLDILREIEIAVVLVVPLAELAPGPRVVKHTGFGQPLIVEDLYLVERIPNINFKKRVVLHFEDLGVCLIVAELLRDVWSSDQRPNQPENFESNFLLGHFGTQSYEPRLC